MHSFASFISNPQVWFGISLAAFLLFAFRVDNAARGLGLTVIDPTKTAAKRDFSLLDLAKIALVIGSVLAVWYTLKKLDFMVTLALLFVLCAYLWITGYRSKIRKLQRTGLSSIENATLLSLFTLSTSSLFIGLVMSAWKSHGAA
jgi:hypothetical protein